MTREEFTALATRPLGATPTEQARNYAAIEFVYTYHLAIKDKKQIAALWDAGGLPVIRAMESSATRAQSIEKHMEQIRAELRKAQEELDAIAQGRN